MQRRLLALSIALAGITFVACDDDPAAPAGTVTAVAITGAPASALAVTRTATLTATVTVTNAAPQTVTWSSSNPAVASVAASGNTATVTAVLAGTATITATSTFDPTKTATASITVISQNVTFSVALSPANEPPGLQGNPTGSGTFNATLDTITNVFSWTSTFSGLTSNINNGHIHGPWAPGAASLTAGVILNFNPAITPGATFPGYLTASSGGTTGTVTLTPALTLTQTVNGDSLKKLLLAGASYVNIHTTTNAGGEIRGQLVRR
jgi:hypothetical protein